MKKNEVDFSFLIVASREIFSSKKRLSVIAVLRSKKVIRRFQDSSAFLAALGRKKPHRIFVYHHINNNNTKMWEAQNPQMKKK